MAPALKLVKNKKKIPMGGVLHGGVPKEKIKYLWQDWIVENQINVISGPPGSNKSTFAMFIASKLSNGLTPENQPVQGSRKTLYYGAEDTPQVISDRCTWFGAKPGKILIVDKYQIDGEEVNVSFDEAKYIENDIEQFKPRLVVFDVFRLFFGSMNIATGPHVQKVFRMLRQWCHDYNVTILLIHHSKAGPKEREDCLEGSEALKRGVRSAAYISKFGIEGEHCRIIAPLKMSWSKEPTSLYFYIGSEGPEMRINVGGQCDYNLDEILRIQSNYAKDSVKARLKKIGVNEDIADE
jgi:KaiC/GvpD/RAD55 family RecA-like ATPase